MLRWLLLICWPFVCLPTGSFAQKEPVKEVFGRPVHLQKAAYRNYSNHSIYIPMRDSVRLAVDVILPKGLKKGARIPALVVQTRYWRNYHIKGPLGWFVPPAKDEWKSFFTGHGYALIVADVRGTGASFGCRPNGPWSEEEIRDGYDLTEWIVQQPWSNQKVGAIGISYDGNAAAFMATNKHPAVKAVIPMFSDFDLYDDIAFPGGVPNERFIARWSFENERMDNHDIEDMTKGLEKIFFKGVKKVDVDKKGDMLNAAVQDHKDNISTYHAVHNIAFKDDVLHGVDLKMISPFTYRDIVEEQEVAIFSWGGWFDAGTAQGVLKLFNTYHSPVSGIIGPWDHGGRRNASPFLPEKADRKQDLELHHQVCLNFFDRYLRDSLQATKQKNTLTYYTLVEKKWKTTDTWPVAGTTPQQWYFQADSLLSSQKPTDEKASDVYRRDLRAGTGWTNRWWTQIGRPVIFKDRKKAGKYLLSYTSQPLDADMEITGFPVVNLNISANRDDCLLFVYLEAVDQNGEVHYITEGQFRTIHHREPGTDHPFDLDIPYHTFERKDAQPLEPGAITPINFALMPTSILLKKGQRIKVSVAMHDYNSFAKIPSWGNASIEVSRSQDHPSFVELPVIRKN